MRVDIYVPDLQWKEFTDDTYSIQCSVFDCKLDTVASFEIAFVDCVNEVNLFNLYRKDSKKVELLVARKPIEHCKNRAKEEYEDALYSFYQKKENRLSVVALDSTKIKE